MFGKFLGLPMNFQLHGAGIVTSFLRLFISLRLLIVLSLLQSFFKFTLLTGKLADAVKQTLRGFRRAFIGSSIVGNAICYRFLTSIGHNGSLDSGWCLWRCRALLSVTLAHRAFPKTLHT
jgi:hypothetical protein